MPDRLRLRNNFGSAESDEAAGRLPRKNSVRKFQIPSCFPAEFMLS